MKNVLVFVVLSVLLAACGASTDQNGNSQDLAGLKNELIAKEKQFNEIRVQIDTLKARITALDPDFDKKEIAVVELIQLKKGDFKHFVEVQGAIQADEEVMVSSELPGKIISLRVKEGDRVNQGQLIARIDAESAEKGIEELQKSLEMARDLYERQQRLWEQNIGSEIQFLQAKNTKERLEKSLESAQLSLKKANIFSPISGTVTMVLAEQGEITSPGVPIVKLINTSKVKLTADVPESYIRDVKRNDYVGVKVPVLDMEQQARVTRVGTVIDNSNRTFEVEVRLNNPGLQLKPNLLAMLMINDYEAKDAVTVPLQLVQQDVSGNSYVFVAEPADSLYMVTKKLVETGIAFDGFVEILSGLEGNEMLISTGSQYLAEGQQVAVKS